MPFLGFILTCLEEIYKTPVTEDEKITKIKPIELGSMIQEAQESKNKTSKTKQERVQLLGQTVLPIFTILFVIGYAITALYLYFNPDLTHNEKY